MSDALLSRGLLDRSRININETWELDYWSQYLNVPKDQLKQVVGSVGVSVSKVRAALGCHAHPVRLTTLEQHWVDSEERDQPLRQTVLH